MRARIVTNTDIILDNITNPEEDMVMERFTVIVNNRFINPDSGGFNGVYRRYNRAQRRLARPFLGELRALCLAQGVPLVVVDERRPWSYSILAQTEIGSDFLPGITLEQYQIDAIKLGCRVEAGVYDIPPGGGKCLGLGTPVMMADGSIKAVEAVEAGDLLMGDDSTPRLVLSTCAGIDDLYEVSQVNGDPYVVNSAHILSLITSPTGKTAHDRYRKLDLPVLDYVSLSHEEKRHLMGYKAISGLPRCGISVRPIGRGEYFGFEIDGNKRFLLGDFTVTHNTEVMAGLCKAIKCPTVILADQRIVIDQIKQRLELRDIIDEVGLFYAGRTPDNQVIVAGSVQSLQIPSRVPPPPQESDAFTAAKKIIEANREKYGLESDGDPGLLAEQINILADSLHIKAVTKHQSTLRGFRKRKARAKQFQTIVKKAEMLLVDECDVASGAQWRNVFRHIFKGRRRYGFSGTLNDPAKPVENLFIQEHLGSVLMKVDRLLLENLGRIIPVEYLMFALGDTPDERSTFDIAVREKMVDNSDFHRLIAAICHRYKEERTLILVERDALGEALAAAIPGSVFIHGKTPKRRRDDVLRAFERQEIRVVIGGKIIRRGLDLKGGCENLIIATGGKLWSTFNQQIGRAVRVNERGFGRVFDFLLLSNKYLYAHSRARLRAMVDMGYKTRVVFPDGQQINGADFIASRFRRPRVRTQIGRPVR